MRTVAIFLVLCSLFLFSSAQSSDSFTLPNCNQYGVSKQYYVNNTNDDYSGTTLGIAFTDATNTSVYVTAADDGIIYKTRLSDGRLLGMWNYYNGSEDSTYNIPVAEPNGIDVDANGYIYVADSDSSMGGLFKLAPNFGGVVAIFMFPNGLSQSAYAVHVDKKTNLVYVGTSDGPVLIFDTAGNYVSNITQIYSGAGNNQRIYAIWTDAASNVYFADQGNQLAYKVASANHALTVYSQGTTSSTDSTPATFDDTFGIYVDGAGYVYVTDFHEDVFVFPNNYAGGSNYAMYSQYAVTTTQTYSPDDSGAIIGDGSTFVVSINDQMYVTTCGYLPGASSTGSGTPAPTPSASSSSTATQAPTPHSSSSSTATQAPTPHSSSSSSSAVQVSAHSSSSYSSSSTGSTTPAPSTSSSTGSSSSLGNNSGLSSASFSLLTLAVAMLSATAVLLF
jgi:hypothetical protein